MRIAAVALVAAMVALAADKVLIDTVDRLLAAARAVALAVALTAVGALLIAVGPLHPQGVGA